MFGFATTVWCILRRVSHFAALRGFAQEFAPAQKIARLHKKCGRYGAATR
jgi:hypothetical protein